MSEKDQTAASESRTTAGSSTGGTSRWHAVLPVVTLLIGVLLGGVIAGVAVDRYSTDEPAPAPTEGETGAGDDETTSEDLQVVVPKECLDAAATVEEATDVLREGVGAVRDFERQPLLDVLNRLEDLEVQAREQAERCTEVDVGETP